MKRFNLSEWAVTHQPMVLFLIILTLIVGIFSFSRLGRLEAAPRAASNAERRGWKRCGCIRACGGRRSSARLAALFNAAPLRSPNEQPQDVRLALLATKININTSA